MGGAGRPSIQIMRYIRQRRQVVKDVPVDRYERQRLSEVRQERCGVCWDRWPASMMTTEDGFRRCPDCVDIRTEERKAQIREYDAAQIEAKYTKPQVSQSPLNDSSPPFIRSMTDGNGTTVTPQAPLNITRSGSTKTLILTGGGFASGDTFSWSAGLSATTSLTGSTQWTLTVTASGGATPGNNHFTFNNHTYRNLIRVG